MTIESPLIFCLALIVAALTWWFSGRDRVAAWVGLGVLCVGLGVADIGVKLGRPDVVVLIDASPSTRGMWFRDIDRVRTTSRAVAPGASLRFMRFANGAAQTIDGDPVEEIASDMTALPAIVADGVLLFSDGRLAGEASPGSPWFPIVRSEATPRDARVMGAHVEADRVVVDVHSDGPPATLRWPDGSEDALPNGTVSLSHSTIASEVRVMARDLWPENDAITLPPAPALFASQRWWIGGNPPSGFRAVDPSQLLPWTSAAVVVVNNVPASNLPGDALARYVRDAGGSVVLVGGNRSFSAGDWANTPIDALSPLASRPPTPAKPWVILVDASGSMAGVVNGQTKLERAIDAARGLLDSIGPDQPITLGSVARDLRWWPTHDPPADLVANGPTNLSAALGAVALRFQDARVVLISDGQAEVEDRSALAATLTSKQIRIDWIALGDESAADLAAIVRATGGSIIRAGQPQDWRQRAVAGLRETMKIPPTPGPVSGRWVNGAPLVADQVNAITPRDETTTLIVRDADGAPLAAQWRVGLGRVAAIAFAASPDVVTRVADAIAATPTDPASRIEWLSDRVAIETESPAPLAVTRTFADGVRADVPVTRVGPTRYEAMLDRSATPSTVAVLAGQRVLDARAWPGTFAAEFDRLGVDRDALARIASRTGGAVIDADAANQPVFHRPTKSLAWPLLSTGVASIAAALILARRATH